jgi:ribosomal protein L10
MAITKVQKQDLVKQYSQDLQGCKNLVVFKQSGLAVSTDANIRKEVREED